MNAEKQASTRKRFKKTATIQLLVTGNPKREGSLAHKRFALYKDGMTIADYIAAGGRTGDINYDVANQLIEVIEA